MAFEDFQYIPEKTAAGHVLDILSYFDRPRNALASAFNARPDESALWAALEGLRGNRETSWGDVFGLEAGQESDEWAPWLAKQGGRLAADVLLDPLNLLFAPAKAAGVYSRAAKATMPFLKEGQSLAGYAAAPVTSPVKNWLAGTGAARLGMTTLPKSHPLFEQVEPLLTEAERAHSLEPLRQTWAQTNTRLGELLSKREGVSPADIFEAVERPGSRPELQDLVDIVEPFRQQMEAATGQWRGKLEAIGHEVPGVIDEPWYNYLPHFEINPGPSDYGRFSRLGEAEAYSQARRELKRWEDSHGNVIKVGKLDDPRTGITTIKEGDKTRYYYAADDFRGKDFIPEEHLTEVFPKAASLKEAKQVAPERMWQENPLAAIYQQTAHRRQQMKFLDVVEKGLDEGWLVREGSLRGAGAKEKFLVDAPGFGLTEPGFGRIYATDKALANRLNNLANAPYDTSSVWGVIGEALNRTVTSKAGQALGAVTQPWKEWTLAHPGWLFGNLATNPAMAATEMPWYNIPARYLEARQLRKADDPLYQEMVLRGVYDSGQYGSREMRNELTKQLKGPGLLERTLGEPGEKAAGAIDTFKKYTMEPIFNVGSKTEGDMKAAVVLDWLKTNAPDWQGLPAKERGRVLDQAAQVGHDALLNYSREAMTPFTRDASALFPFLGWNLGILKRTGELAATKPQVLANQGRLLDAALMPMSPEEENIADPWVRESGPIVGALGSKFGTNEKGLPTMFQTARFLPQGVVEQFAKRPMDAALSWVNPYIKTPFELIANYSMFKNRPLDITAASFPENLANPILQAAGSTNAPYELASNRYFGASVPAAYESVMNLLPQMRHIREINAMGANRLWDNPAQEPTSAIETGMNYLAGGKMYPYDISRYQKNRKWEAEQQERRIKANRKYAAQMGDMGKVEFYNQQLIDRRLRGGAGMLSD